MGPRQLSVLPIPHLPPYLGILSLRIIMTEGQQQKARDKAAEEEGESVAGTRSAHDTNGCRGIRKKKREERDRDAVLCTFMQMLPERGEK